MLPAQHRMRRAEQFGATVRRGRRVGGKIVVVHHLRRSFVDAGESCADGDPALVGLVVGKSVGSSVIRHRVSRRLRAQLASRLDQLGDGSSTVVRALPGAADASSAELSVALDRAFARMAPSGGR